jgi:hypothetical protein
MSKPDASINNVTTFKPVDANEKHVDKTIKQIKQQMKQTRKDLFTDFGLKPKDWMNTIRINPAAGSGAGNGTEMPDPMGYTDVSGFQPSTAVDVDEGVQEIKRVMEVLRKKLFTDNGLVEKEWMHTVRIAPKDNLGKQDTAHCGCGS